MSKGKKKEKYRLRTEYFETLKAIGSVVNLYIQSHIDNHFDISPRLKELILKRYNLGKIQLRSAQVRFAYEIVGGRNWENIIPACAALVLKEVAYYCLDDYFDKNIKLKNLLLLGTPFIAMSYGIIGELNNSFSNEQIKLVIKELYKLDELCGQGFLIEPELSLDDESNYMKKVYCYNFWEQSLRIGAILGNGSKDDIKKLGEIGKNIGMGYIIANDTYDFGKSLEDFQLGKYTLPIVWAFKNTIDGNRKTLKLLFGKKDLSEKEKDTVRGIVVKSGAIKHGKSIANQFCEIGLELLSGFRDSMAKKMLEFATTFTQKNKYYDLLKKFE